MSRHAKLSHILLGISLGLCAFNPRLAAEPSGSRISTFQKFANGEVPIKEAVFFRQISGTNGYVNKEWCRFGYQNGAWFVQILKPAETNASEFTPKDSLICGASYTQTWSITDNRLDVAENSYAKGSHPESLSAVGRSLISEALSLGIPRQLGRLKLPSAAIQWDGSKFKTIVDTKWDASGVALASAPTQGELQHGANGLPISASYSGVEGYPAGTVTYEYSREIPEIPKVFVLKYSQEIYRYEFISLIVGSNSVASAKGFEPSMFADMNHKRFVNFYTNELAYEQTSDGSYPAFRPATPKMGAPPPELQGSNWINSKPLTLAGLHGQVVLLDFWSVQCVPCILALPHAQELYDKYKNDGLVVIGVCQDWGSEAQARRILKEHHITYPNLMDKDLPIASLKTSATVRNYVPEAGIPCYALIDRAGNLAWKTQAGELPTEAQIEALLKWSAR